MGTPHIVVAYSSRQAKLADEPWRAFAECKDMDTNLFFPVRGERIADEVRQACNSCPVSSECLAWAIESNQHFGVWGGASESERNRMRRDAQRSKLKQTCFA